MNISDQRIMRQFNRVDYHPTMAESFDNILRNPNGRSIPGTQQQAISLRIAAALLRHVESENLGRVLQAPCGIVLSKKLIRPDILYIAWERRGIIGEANLHAAPDLVVEVVADARGNRILRTRRGLYSALGVREYWVVSPDIFTVEVMIWSELGYISAGVYGSSDVLYSPLLPKFRMPLSSVFQPEFE
jgi:Uma2 family endonuclease